MDFREINVPEGIVPHIDHEVFADITVDNGNVENADIVYPNVNSDMLYEYALEEIEKTLGSVPVSMKLLPRKVLIHNWSSWKGIEEINRERTRYLLNTDEMFEEMLNQAHG